MQHKNSTERGALRNTLLENGYIPLPLASKGVYIKGWSRAEITADWLAPYARIGKYPNTGLRCDNLVAFDIDVLDENLADACEEYVEQRAGETELCRVGKWPKRLLVYRLAELDAAMIRSGRTGNYGGHMCELLATHGRQFAAFGMHPSGAPYKWEGLSPLTTPLDKIDEIDAETALSILDGLDELLADTGLEKLRAAHRRGVAGAEEWDLYPNTEVMAEGEIVEWADLIPQLDSEGMFGNLWRPEQNAWGDSDAVHFYLAHGSREPCAHDFVNDCTHWSSIYDPRLAQLLPPVPVKGNVFVDPEIEAMITGCVLMRDNTVRRLSSPTRSYPMAGWVSSHQHLRVADPNPPPSNPNKTIEFVKAWRQDPNTLRADYVALRPDHAPGIVKTGDESVLNMYLPPSHDAQGGEVATFYEFLEHLLPHDNELEIFTDWLAHKVQHPADRMHGMVMVTPAYGTGRGTLVQIMQKLFGIEYVNEVELHDLIGTSGQSTFNSYMADSIMVTVGEALEEREDMSKWQARHVAYERLKVVCDPISNRMHVRRKYGTNSTEQIYASLFISSNHLDALVIEEGDRRLIVLDNTEVPLVDAGNLAERIHDWKQSDANIAELHRVLRARKVRYDAKGQPPMTPAKQRMIESGQSDVDRLFDMFVEQCKGDVVTPAQWRQFAHSARLDSDLDLPADPTRRENALNVVIQNRARRIDSLPRNQLKISGRAVRPWIVRHFGVWRAETDTDKIRAEILKNGDPVGSNVVKLPTK